MKRRRLTYCASESSQKKNVNSRMTQSRFKKIVYKYMMGSLVPFIMLLLRATEPFCLNHATL